MKIIQLTTENVQKITAAQITPDGALVQICGKNGAGKTSVLNSIWWALGGLKEIPDDPIRHGADKATITLTVGPYQGSELIITRTMKRGTDGAPIIHDLKVTSGAGARFPGPQAMVAALIGKLSLDPLAFAREKPAQQFEVLKTFVKDFDFKAHEKERALAFEARTSLNRDVKSLESQAAAKPIKPGLPESPIDVNALTEQLLAAGKTNTEIQLRQAKREEAARALEEGRKRVRDVRAEAERLEQQADALFAEMEALDAKIEAAPPLPPLVVVEDLQQEIREANILNAQIKDQQERVLLEKRIEETQAQAAAKTAAIAALDAKKAQAISEAALPVPEIGFGDECVTLGGVPFGQASSAEQLRASMALAMALAPELRILRVSDGPLLDSESMRLVEEMATTRDFQVWIERVDESGEVGFVIEDGHVRGQDIAPAPKEPPAKPSRKAASDARLAPMRAEIAEQRALERIRRGEI